MRHWMVAFALTLPLAPTPLPAEAPPLINPAGAPLDKDASLDQVLVALHKTGVDLKDFSADVSMAVADVISDPIVSRGKALFSSNGEGGGRFRVNFTEKQINEKIDKTGRQEYLLDPPWLVDRDYKRKQEVKRQVLKPGEKMNIFKLGEGPFPLPIGQPPEDVKKQFEVKKIDPKPGDPADTVHIQLTPKPGEKLARKFKTIDVWVDIKTRFPKRLETWDKNGNESHTVDFSELKVNAGIGEKAFDLDKLGDGWLQKTEPLGE